MPPKRTATKNASRAKKNPPRAERKPKRTGTTSKRLIKATRPGGKKHLSCPIVGIGGSAGGYEAASELLKHLPPLFELVPVAVYTCDAEGVLGAYNRRATELWGLEPERNGSAPKFCGSYKIYYPDGRPMPHEKCPMARALRGEKLTSKDLEIIIERPNGEMRHVIPAPRILTDEQGNITGAINCLFDITDRKRTEQRLAERSRLLDLTNDAILVRNSQDKVIYWNQGAQELYGYTREEALGKIAHDLLRTDHAQSLAAIRKTLHREGRWSGEMIHTCKDGEQITVFSQWSLDRDTAGKQAFVLETNTDITDRKRAEEARSEISRQQLALYEFSQRNQEARLLDETYESALDVILTALRCDRASILLYDQQQVMRFVAWRGLSKRYRSAVEGHSPWKPNTKNPRPVCFGDINLADIPEPLKSTIRSESICAAAFIPMVSDRLLVGKFMMYYNAPHDFTDDELKLAITIAQQLTHAIQHKQDEEALHESEERLRAIVEQANAGMVRYDIKGHIRFANPTFCRMLGYKESELIGKSVREITHPDDVEKTTRAFKRVESKGEASELDKRYVRKNGSVVWVNVCDAPELDARGRSKFVVAVVVDITARRKAEEALRRSKEALEDLVQQRTKALVVANAELSSEIERRKGLEGEILSVSDREQQRLGQELHDGLCQHLTAVAFMSRSIALRLRNHRVIDASDIEKIAQLVNDAATDTRNLSRALHRLDVDAAGLIDALQDLVDREIWRTPCRLEVKPSFEINDDNVASHLYRIAREAVINANKHAQAREIVVRLESSRKELVLRVIDDGVGLAADRATQQGLGFHIMKYRAQLIGARLKIAPRNMGGTSVSCYLPNNSPKLREAYVRQNAQPAVVSRNSVRPKLSVG